MNINRGINQFRMLPQQQKLDNKIIEQVKEGVIEKAQETSIQKSDASEGYGNASSQQYLANMNIQFISRNNLNNNIELRKKEKPTTDNNVVKNQVSENIEQIESALEGVKPEETTEPTTKSPVMKGTAAAAAGAAASVASTGAASAASGLGQEVLINGTTLLGQSYKGTLTGAIETKLGVMSTADMASGLVSSFQTIAENTADGSFQSILDSYCDEWVAKNGVENFVSENMGQVMNDFFKDVYNLDFVNLGKNILKTLGKTTLISAAASLAVKIGVDTIIDVLPGFLKDASGVCKDWWNNVKTGNIGGALKNVVWDAPMVLLKTAGNTVKHLAINTWDTAVSVVKPAVVGTWNTVKAAGVGAWNTVKAAGVGVWNTVTSPIRGVIAGGKALVNGFKNGIQNFKDGKILKGVGNILGGTLKAIGKPIDGIINIGTNAVKTVWNVGKNIVKTGVNVIKNAGKTIKDVSKAVFGEPVKTVVKAVKTAGKVVVEGAKAVGKGVAKAANWVANGVKKVFKGW